jgi:conjugative relaxase-like TrwC/TraI family protein
MLRIIQLKSGKAAESYYTKGLSDGDYYVKDSKQEISGEWGGKLSKELKLNGQVTSEEFKKLCVNINPNTGEKLTLRETKNRTPAYDFNFHVPKSVSIAHAFTDDKANIEKAFKSSVKETLTEIEKNMQTRVRKAYTYDDRNTGNIAYAEFTHYTARPVDGFPDPHLHGHYIVFNATKDKTEGKIKAGKFLKIKENAPYFEAIFHRNLQNKLVDLGYSIDEKGKYWEIQGVSKLIIERFSRRANLIDKTAQEKGILTNRIKDTLGQRTRENKVTDYSMQELKNLWSMQLSKEEKESLNQLKNYDKNIHKNILKTPQESITYGINHVLERNSVAKRMEILTESLRYGTGLQLNQLNSELNKQIKQGNILSTQYQNRDYITTSSIFAQESSLIGYVDGGKGKNKPLSYKQENLQNYLNNEQNEAVNHVMTSRDSVMFIEGRAGTGKTTMMKEAKSQIESHGKILFTFAPTAQASRGVLRKEGFNNADTVSRYLKDEVLQQSTKNQIVWIDEAGLLSSNDLKKVFETARSQNSRVILSGDTNQHTSVERGDALRLALQSSKDEVPKLSTIHRQKNKDYKKVVELASEGKTTESFTKLDSMKSIYEVADEKTRYNHVAKEYVTYKKDGKSTLVISPTHKEGEMVNQAIREELKSEKLLDKEEFKVITQQNLNFTNVEKSDPRKYENGYMVIFNQKMVDFEKNETIKVEKVDVDKVILEGNKKLPISNPKSFTVFKNKEIQIAKNEIIRLNKNGMDENKNEYRNGDFGRVLNVNNKRIQIELEKSSQVYLKTSQAPINYGYVSTSHQSQGRTVDHVIIAQSGYSQNATNDKQWYVSVSRGRESVSVYTENKEQLKDSIQKNGDRKLAHEVFRKSQVSKNMENRINQDIKSKPQSIVIQRLNQSIESNRIAEINRTPTKEREMDRER